MVFVYIFGILLAFGLIFWIIRASFKTSLFLLGIVIIVFFGIQTLIGYSIERISYYTKIRNKLNMFFIFFLIAFALNGLVQISNLLSFSTISLIVSLVLYATIVMQSSQFDLFEKITPDFKLLQNKKNLFFTSSTTSFILLLSSIFIHYICLNFYSSFPIIANYEKYIGIIYWVASFLAQLFSIALILEIKNIYDGIDRQINNNKLIYFQDLYNELKGESSILDEDEYQLFIDFVLVYHIKKQTIIELNLYDTRVIVDSLMYNNAYSQLYCVVTKKMHKEVIVAIVQNLFGLPTSLAEIYIESYIEFGTYFYFPDGRYFAPYRTVKTCVSCGTANEIDENKNHKAGEWYCSKLCQETEENCLNLKNQSYEEFIGAATSTGFVLMQNAFAWSDNHKIFAAGGQGHGFAAENANNMIDTLHGKDAKVIGGDYAKNGPDRLVNGVEIQTKYCGTGRESVNAAFDGEGSYKYINNDGMPMQLEVPKDQYDAALKTLKIKIQEGKVPGVTNPDDAEKILIKGSITYDQARNITKFGTIESLTYDFAESIVTGISAAGISFTITAVVYYVKTKNKTESLQAALLQAGTAFAKSIVVYIGTQQLHRLSAVQNLLSGIDIAHFPPSLQTILQDGLGVSRNGVTKMLRGTLVSSIVLISISTAPDILKLVRGRMSSKQLMKNMAVTSSSVAGGFIGSVAGGALCTPLGPIGIIAGRFVGGMVGGSLFAIVSNKIAKTLMKEDNEYMLEIITIQFEYLAVSFMLNEEEISNIQQNLQNTLNQKVLERMFQYKENYYAFANSFLKPIVVSVVKQRPQLNYTNAELENSYKLVYA